MYLGRDGCCAWLFRLFILLQFDLKGIFDIQLFFFLVARSLLFLILGLVAKGVVQQLVFFFDPGVKLLCIGSVLPWRHRIFVSFSRLPRGALLVAHRWTWHAEFIRKWALGDLWGLVAASRYRFFASLIAVSRHLRSYGLGIDLLIILLG